MRNKANKLTQISVENSVTENLMWFEQIKGELFSIGLGMDSYTTRTEHSSSKCTLCMTRRQIFDVSTMYSSDVEIS